MAASTPRFGLNYFDASTDGDLADDGLKFTGEDRLTIDAVLAALEKHDHRPVQLTDGPVAIPTAEYDEGGDLEGGTEYFYVVSFLTADGLETAAGPETSVATPDPLATPPAPSVETSEEPGSLTEGVYYYALTSVRGQEESAISDFDIATVLEDEHAVIVTLPALEDGAEHHQVWRMKETDPSWTRVGTTTAATWTDDGSVPAAAFGDPDNVPPDEATDQGQYLITVTLTGADVTALASDENIIGWRLYRTTDSGAYSAASLVHEVIERTSDTDPDAPLLNFWVDDGDEPLTGSPRTRTNQLQVTPYTFETATTLPPTTGYPANYPLLVADTLYYNKSGTWIALSGGSGSGSPSTGLLDFRGPFTPPTQYPPGALVTYTNGLWHARTTTGTTPGFTTGGGGVTYFSHITLSASQPAPTSGYQAIGQQFRMQYSTVVNQVQLYFDGNQPVGQPLAVAFATTANIDTSLITTGFFQGTFPAGTGYLSFPLSAPVTLPADTDLWLVALYGDTSLNPGLTLGLQGTQSNGLTFTGSSYSRRTDYNQPLSTDPALGGYMLVYKLIGTTPIVSYWDLLGYTVPTGGTSGQVLTKNAAANGAYTWAAPTGGSGGASTTLVHRRLTSDLVATAAGNQRIFTSTVPIAPGETWELAAELVWTPNARMEWYVVIDGDGFDTSAAISGNDGEIWYPDDATANDYSAIKHVSGGGAIGTGDQDTGRPLTLTGSGGQYPLRFRYVVTNTSTTATLGATVSTYVADVTDPGASVTIKANSYMRATRIS